MSTSYKAQGFVLATQRERDSVRYVDVSPDIMTKDEAAHRLRAMTAAERSESVVVPVIATVHKSDVYAELIKHFEQKIAELEKNKLES